MKTLITYFTLSGNTKRVAEAIHEVIEGEKDIRPLVEVKSLEDYNIIFIGAPVHGFRLAKSAKEFLEKHGKGKNIALFVTHSAPEDSERLLPAIDNCKKAVAETNLVGFFNCQGELAQDIADAMSKSDDPNVVSWAQERDKNLGQPDSTKLEQARAFAKEIMLKMS
ncbi:flavodoxin family protein [Chloroflexota bacterium]